MVEIQQPAMRYTFGHTDTAADRLERIAGFFNPLAAAILFQSLTNKVERAADFGCGPGYTTDMVAKATRAYEITGIDISPYFLDLAKSRYPEYHFLEGNVTSLESKAKYDFIYCRFLLSHLQHIEEVIPQWIGLLRKGGILFIDELESIHTEIPVFRKYLQVNRALIKSQGAELFIGDKLDACVNRFTCIRSSSDLIPVADSLAASWFYPNTISVWKNENFISHMMDNEEINQLSEELWHIWHHPSCGSNITWKMKRILLTT